MTITTRTRRALALLTALALGAGLAGCAGGPTSSPENAARAFLDAMKADDLAAALEVVGRQPLLVNDEEWEPLPEAEQKAASTGITAYEILDLHQESETRATVVAGLTGGDLPEVELSLERGGKDGSQWLVSWVTPGFTAIEVAVPEHWTLTLDGGTKITQTDENLRYLMLPGTTISGKGTWTDEEGYFEPFPAGVRESSAPGGLMDLVAAAAAEPVATQKMHDKAEKAVIDLMDRQIAEVKDLIAANPDRARLVTEATYEITEILPYEYHGLEVSTAIQWGVIEVCRSGQTWQMFGTGAPALTTITFNGYPTDDRHHLGNGRRPAVWAYEDFDTEIFTFSPEDNRPLSDCGV